MDNKEKTKFTDAELAQFKQEFIDIWEKHVIPARNGSDKLLDWLLKTDFFEAPASTRYHGATEGGLLIHSLNVYHMFKEEISQALCSPYVAPESKRELQKISPDSIAIMALCHDFCKINFYKKSTRNVKNEETGKWEKVPFYETDDTLGYGHGEGSVFIIERFMKLSLTEALSIRWHMGGFDTAVKGGDYAQSKAWTKYAAAPLLHIADLKATYLMGE